MAFQHIQEILDEHEREGYNIDAEDLDSEEPAPPSEELVHEPEIGLNFAAILKKGPPEKKKEKKQTFFLCNAKLFPIMGMRSKRRRRRGHGIESDLETPEKNNWSSRKMNLSLRKTNGKQEEDEEEKVPLQEKVEEPSKEEESDRQEENFKESEEQEETPRLTLKESVKENVFHEEKEENDCPILPPPEDKANGLEGVEAKVQEESEKCLCNIAKILPVPKSAAPAENSLAKPTGSIKNPEVTRPTKGDNWKMTRPQRCGPLKQCGGKPSPSTVRTTWTWVRSLAKEGNLPSWPGKITGSS
ncbi:chromo domain-containing protein cec-1-like [Macrobrachium nipponense]|uniref:chromo domain-containing protein cec-1-like n=1 Tax=Macrobrachium nipponense TaxID=159736 RepID=UPI0030C886E2